MRLLFLCEKSGAIALVLQGLMAGRQGRQAGWLAGWPADEIVLNSNFFKIIYRIKYSSFCYVQQTYSIIIDIPMHFSQFLCKAYSKVDFGHAKISDAMFLGSIPTIKH